MEVKNEPNLGAAGETILLQPPECWIAGMCLHAWQGSKVVRSLVCLCSSGACSEAFAFAGRELYHLNPAPSPFLLLVTFQSVVFLPGPVWDFHPPT
jgi:hypothetical protein